MNFLILSVTAGEGHNSTAKALKTELEARDSYCTIVDTFDYVSPELAKIISEGYLLVTERAKYAYKIGYSLAEKRRQSEHGIGINVFKYAMSDDLAKYINSDSFDAVIFTHPFAGILLDVMKTRKTIANRTVGILTDFTFHPYWEDCTHNDYVVTPDKLLNPQGKRKGFTEEQILPFGIPIKPSFSKKMEKADAREKLGLNKKLTTFLLMGGSMGYGNISENVKKIDACAMDRDFQLICVCGNNAEMKVEVDKIAETSRHRILVTGFVDYISTIMDASDCIISKPGGLTTSESLVKGLPMIIINPIPGQEERNATFLTNNGCAMSTTKTCPIDECIYQLIMSDTRLETMSRSIAEIAKPNSTSDMCEFLLNLAHTPVIEQSGSGSEDGRIYFDV